MKKEDKKTDDIIDIQPGDIVRVHETIKEKNAKGEEKQRVQVFEGIVLAHKHGNEVGATITVRKESGGVGVEKIFPIHLPTITKIEIKKQAQVRQAKLGFLKDPKKKYKKRLKNVPLTPAK